MICMLLAYLTVHAQFTSVNSFLRKEIVSYIKNENGFYVKNVNKMTDVVVGVVESYAYDKKAQNLYVLTESSNVVVTLTKDYAKIIKRNKGIPQLSGEELDKEVQMRTKLLNDKYESLNREREQQIVDSIKKARQEEIDSINKAIQDSIDKANRLQAMIEAQAEYRRTHAPNDVPLGNVSLKRVTYAIKISTQKILPAHLASAMTRYTIQPMKRVNLVSIIPKPISLKFLVLSKATKILNIITRCSKTV